MIAAAACDGSIQESSDGCGGSTIDWEKVATYEETCRAPGNSVSQLEEDSTNAEWSEALGEDIEAWESQDVLDALDACHKATIDLLKEPKKVVDSQPPDGSVFDTEEMGEGVEDYSESAEDAWAKTTPRSLSAGGCALLSRRGLERRPHARCRLCHFVRLLRLLFKRLVCGTRRPKAYF